jgi:hypothetical protein
MAAAVPLVPRTNATVSVVVRLPVFSVTRILNSSVPP